MTVAVVVHQIAGGEFSQRERDAVDVALAGDLVGTILDFLLLAAETDRLPQIKTSNIRSRFRHSHAGDLAIREASDTGRVGEAAAAGDLRVEHQLSRVPFALPKACVQKDRAGHRSGAGFLRQ